MRLFCYHYFLICRFFMAELIKITPEVRSTVFIIQVGVDPQTYQDLKPKAESGLFLPDPPVILAKMPIIFPNWYEYFLYNGNTRYKIARDYQLPLNGLIVNNFEEVPEDERIRNIPEGIAGVLRYGTIGSFWLKQNRSGLFTLPLDTLLTEYYQKTGPKQT